MDMFFFLFIFFDKQVFKETPIGTEKFIYG